MQPKPEDLYDRDVEWAALSGFAGGVGPGPRLAVVSGRRRHGKSVLLRRLCALTGGFYHQAVEGTVADQLRDLAATYARFLRLPVPPAFESWTQAVDALLALPDTGRAGPGTGGPDAPLPVVLDEFPYLLASAPELASVLQRALDAARDAGASAPRTRLVVCGSAMTTMAALMTGQAPLRGRASLEVGVGPFSFRDTASFLGLDDPVVALRVHAVCGGVPGYYADMLDGDVPTGPGDFDDWIVRGPLSVTRPLLHEARHLLDDAPGLREKSLYVSTLAAITDGHTTTGRIAARLGRSASALAHPLAALVDLGLVDRRQDVLRAGRPTYRVADPLLRLYAAVLRPDWANLEQGLAGEVWRAAQPRWHAQVLGPHVEELARTWAARHASETTLGARARVVGSTVVFDPSRRRSHEVDVIALGADPDTAGHGREPGSTARSRVIALGEAKVGEIGVEQLRRLRHIRTLLADRGLARPDARLLLCSVTGFTTALAREVEHVVRPADRPILVDPARLYGGS